MPMTAQGSALPDRRRIGESPWTETAETESSCQKRRKRDDENRDEKLRLRMSRSSFHRFSNTVRTNSISAMDD
jgi:hypothetical protein